MRSLTPGFANALVVVVALSSLAACNDDVVGPENRTPRPSPSGTWLATAAAHDDFDAAVIITALPFTDSTNTSEAATAADDPDCFGQGPTVWYAFTAAVDGLYEANTFGSHYDTTLGAYAGTRGNLTELACSDDAMSAQSQVQIQIAAGETVYFMVGAYASGPGGELVFNLDVAPPPPPPFTVEFTVDRFGGIDASAGVAFVRGTATCPLWSYFDFYGVLRQRIGRLIVEAPFWGYGECNGTTPWEVEVRAQNALLVGGHAEVIVDAYFYDVISGQSAFAHQNVTVVLRGAGVRQSASPTLGVASRTTLETIRSLDDVIRHDSRLKAGGRVP
jgi:hypothetical protein